MGFTGGLEKMLITAYDASTFTGASRKMTVTINPEKYSQTYEILYNNVQGQGANGGSPDFNRIPSDKLQFELIFDGTGVVPSTIPGVLPYTQDGIVTQIQTFKDLCFSYVGKIHSPRYLEVTWGTMVFRARLKTLTISYTLFKPDGTPLRARATILLIGYTDEKELAKQANKTSPDLTHLVTVKAGDTLPLLCYRIYGTSHTYLQVAAVNNLTDFRQLTVGSQLVFPPIKGVES
ncbi:MAG: LysM peptidoglycan-binding domain-containing protein [Polyangiaceae bacterium]|nr:LysM peptidoglycan-binding domain-containing protein [Polyangiaceae bacterium]